MPGCLLRWMTAELEANPALNGTEQRMLCCSLYCRMEVFFFLFFLLVFHRNEDNSFSPEMYSNLLMLFHSLLLASSAAQLRGRAEWTIGTCTRGSCPSLFPRSRLAPLMQTHSQFAHCSPFSSVIPKSCWAAVLCLISQSQTLKSL